MLKLSRRRLARLWEIGLSRRLIPFVLRRVWQSSRFRFHTLASRFLLWLHAAKVGRGLQAMGLVDIDLFPGSELVIGNNVTLCSAPDRYHLAQYGPVKLRCFSPTARIVLGDRAWLNGAVVASRSRPVVIGAGTIFAGNVVVIDSDHHKLWPPEERMTFTTTDEDRAVAIGENCWLGLNVIVLKGTILGDNVVVGAGSVVAGEFPPNCVIAGSPARIIRHLP